MTVDTRKLTVNQSFDMPGFKGEEPSLLAAPTLSSSVSMLITGLVFASRLELSSLIAASLLDCSLVLHATDSTSLVIRLSAAETERLSAAVLPAFRG